MTTETIPAAGDETGPNAADTAIQQEAIDARSEAEAARKSPEEREAEDAEAKAARARSETVAAEAEKNKVPDAMTVVEARMLVPSADDVGAGDHLAQKFGNYPENPAPAKAEHADPALCTVPLHMTVPDSPLGRRTTKVHPEMVGDYLRAGWSLTA